MRNPSVQQVADDQQIRGRISSFDGGYNLTVADERGFTDNVQLHDGTIINPTGLTLAPGMVVSILGYNAGPLLCGQRGRHAVHVRRRRLPVLRGASVELLRADVQPGLFLRQRGLVARRVLLAPEATTTPATCVCTTTCA